MKRWTEEPGAPWLAEIRKIQGALRELEGPFADLPGLLSPGDAVLGLLADSPEDLPLVAFSPFAALPERPVPGPAGRTAGPVARAGRAPEPPRPSAVTPRPPLASTPPEAPAARRPAATAAEAARERSQGPPVPAPVFSLRPRGPASVPVPRTEPRTSRLAEEPSARAVRRTGEPASPEPSPPGPLSHTHSHPPGRGGTVRFEGGPSSAFLPSTARGRGAGGEGSLGGGAPSPGGREGGWERGMEGEGSGEAGSGLRSEEAAQELLGRLADDALRRRAPAPSSSVPAARVFRPSGTVPPSPPEPLAEMPAPTADRDVEPADLGTLARRGMPSLSAGELESPVTASLLGAPVAAPKRPAEIPAADSSFASPFEAEALADLVNEALIEQARRHGVDLS